MNIDIKGIFVYFTCKRGGFVGGNVHFIYKIERFIQKCRKQSRRSLKNFATRKFDILLQTCFWRLLYYPLPGSVFQQKGELTNFTTCDIFSFCCLFTFFHLCVCTAPMALETASVPKERLGNKSAFKIYCNFLKIIF